MICDKDGVGSRSTASCRDQRRSWKSALNETLLQADQAAWRENLPELQRWLVLADATYLPMCANDSRDRDAAFWSNAAKKFSRTWYETLADRQTSPAAWESQAFLLSASEWQKHLGKKDLGGLSSDALQKVHLRICIRSSGLLTMSLIVIPLVC